LAFSAQYRHIAALGTAASLLCLKKRALNPQPTRSRKGEDIWNQLWRLNEHIVVFQLFLIIGFLEKCFRIFGRENGFYKLVQH
jgi:hypothetical protein